MIHQCSYSLILKKDKSLSECWVYFELNDKSKEEIGIDLLYEFIIMYTFQDYIIMSDAGYLISCTSVTFSGLPQRLRSNSSVHSTLERPLPTQLAPGGTSVLHYKQPGQQGQPHQCQKHVNSV